MSEVYEYIDASCKEFFSRFQLTERGVDLEALLIEFCSNPNENTAKRVFESFLQTFRVSGLGEIVDAMYKFEVTSSSLIASHRDHYVHTVNVFLLGISIFVKNENIQRIVKNKLDYPDAYPSYEEEYLYRWGTTSLFHDVGYPLEIAYNTIKEYSSMVISPSLTIEEGEVVGSGDRQPSEMPVMVLKFPRLDDLLYVHSLAPNGELEEKYCSKYPEMDANSSNNLLRLIAQRISQMGFAGVDTVYNKLKNAIQEGLEHGQLDHGIYSTIVLLKWTNEAYFKSGWNPAYYYFPMVDSAAAIFLHNTYNYIFQIPPFNLGPMSSEDNILAFLLILCDKLQETDRTSYGYDPKPMDLMAKMMYVSNNELKFNFKALIDDKALAQLKIDHLIDSIKKTLKVDDIFETFSINLELG